MRKKKFYGYTGALERESFYVSVFRNQIKGSWKPTCGEEFLTTTTPHNAEVFYAQIRDLSHYHARQYLIANQIPDSEVFHRKHQWVSRMVMWRDAMKRLCSVNVVGFKAFPTRATYECPILPTICINHPTFQISRTLAGDMGLKPVASEMYSPHYGTTSASWFQGPKLTVVCTILELPGMSAIATEWAHGWSLGKRDPFIRGSKDVIPGFCVYKRKRAEIWTDNARMAFSRWNHFLRHLKEREIRLRLRNMIRWVRLANRKKEEAIRRRADEYYRKMENQQ